MSFLCAKQPRTFIPCSATTPSTRGHSLAFKRDKDRLGAYQNYKLTGGTDNLLMLTLQTSPQAHSSLFGPC